MEAIVEAFSQKTLGIKDESGEWWNVEDRIDPVSLGNIQQVFSGLSRGDVVELEQTKEGNGRKFKGIKIKEKAKPQERGMDDYIGFDEILKKAHHEFGESLTIRTRLKFCDGMWIAKALVDCNRKKHFQTFTGHGDATEKNVGEHLKNALPRMAETRAIARALRFALGESMVREELSEEKE